MSLLVCLNIFLPGLTIALLLSGVEMNWVCMILPESLGRNTKLQLETLLASGDSKDWVKISDMFLGPAPDRWTFTPKHKSNSYENGTIVGQG